MSLSAAIDGGLQYLEQSRTPDGLWKEFDTPAGESNEWVTGFVAASLRGTHGARPMLTRAVRALLARSRGGWGYSERLPVDCDSTAWCLLAIGPHGARPMIIARAVDVVLAHQSAEAGGFSTYAGRDAVNRLIARAGDADGARGWLLPQPCVTAAAVGALLAHGEPASAPHVRAGLAYLCRCRAESLWGSYWWPGNLYATYFGLRACAWGGTVTPTDLRASVAAVLDQRTGPAWGAEPGDPASAFATALGVLITLLDPESRAARAGALAAAAWLAEQQRADGAWAPSAQLVIPESELGRRVVRVDERGLFATAVAVRALSVVKHALGEVAA